MRTVFVDTSGFYAHLDPGDPFHATATELFVRAGDDAWNLVTTNYVLLETVALIQNRLGWVATDQWRNHVLRHCRVAWVDESLHRLGEARWVQARERRLSLTDCVSLEFMRNEGITEAIAQDDHFTRAGIGSPGR